MRVRLGQPVRMKNVQPAEQPAEETALFTRPTICDFNSTSKLTAPLAVQLAAQLAVQLLVERFDIEPFSDFTTKRSNFGGLVLGCIDSHDSNQIVILQGFARSTRFAILCTAQISKFQQKFVKLFSKFCLHCLLQLDNPEEARKKPRATTAKRRASCAAAKVCRQ